MQALRPMAIGDAAIKRGQGWHVSKTPKTLWLIVDDGEWAGDVEDCWFATKREAKDWAQKRADDGYPSRVLGPYVLRSPHPMIKVAP